MKSLKLLKLEQEVVFMSVEKVTISKSEYEALLDAKEELEDIQAVKYALANPEEGMPSALVERLIDGENPLSLRRKPHPNSRYRSRKKHAVCCHT